MSDKDLLELVAGLFDRYYGGEWPDSCGAAIALLEALRTPLPDREAVRREALEEAFAACHDLDFGYSDDYAAGVKACQAAIRALISQPPAQQPTQDSERESGRLEERAAVVALLKTGRTAGGEVITSARHAAEVIQRGDHLSQPATPGRKEGDRG